MIRIILVIFYVFCFLDVRAQVNNKSNDNKVDLSFIQNGKIKYSFVMLSCDTCVPITNVGIKVRVELSNEDDLLLKKISNEEWLKLINNDSSDFVAIVILYQIYNKNAIGLLFIDDIDKWRKYLKKEEVEYWNDELKK
jgi:hypothetical protein